jgi:hypothetical protein
MSKMYLEWKPVFFGPINSGYFHFYLVLREDPASPAQLNDLTWRQSGDVLRGGLPGLNPTDNLVIQTGALSASRDAITSQSDLNSRGILEIGNAALWPQLTEALNGIGGSQYRYESPTLGMIGGNEAGDHISNSNATIFSLLNSVGIDLRTVGFPAGLPVPGAVANPTLLGFTGTAIMASDNLTDRVTLLGRDNRDDKMRVFRAKSALLE